MPRARAYLARYERCQDCGSRDAYDTLMGFCVVCRMVEGKLSA